jgi:DNA-binding MarR family transcriptional regulator
MSRSKETFRLEVADRLHSASIHLLRHAAKQDVLAGTGPARLSALSVLVFGGPMALGQLAAAEQVKAPTMSRIVAGLKRSGLAKIEADQEDARRIRVTATSKGKRLLQQARARRIQLLAKTFSDLRGPEMDTLLKAAELMEGALKQAAGKNNNNEDEVANRAVSIRAVSIKVHGHGRNFPVFCSDVILGSGT